MNEWLNEVDAVVLACATKHADLARVQTTMRAPAKSRWRCLLRFALAGCAAAASILAFFSGFLGPTAVFARERVARSYGIRQDPPAQRVSVAVKDINGKAQTPFELGDKKATVLFFLLPDCPISNAYAPEIKRICAEYESKKITAFVVHADPDVTLEQARKHTAGFGFKCPVLLDPTHVLVQATGVTIAPEVAVVGPDRKVLYRGRIDDWYAGFGKRRAAPTQRDLRVALDAIIAGKAVATPRTEAIGCFLPEAKK